MQVRVLPESSLEGLPSGAVSRLENGWAQALGVRLPLLPLRSGVVERKDARLLIAKRRFDPCRQSRRSKSGPASPGRVPPWSNGNDAGLSIRKLRVRIPPGVLMTTACRGDGHPVGFGRRRSLVRLQPGRSRRRGVAVPASLMSSRPWVRIPPALLHSGDVAQRQEQSLVRRKVRRFESGRPRCAEKSGPLRRP
jgi:hypothetical protein